MPSKPKAKPESLARVHLRLSQELWDRAQHAAIDKHITLSELVAAALAAYLKGRP